MSPPPPSQMRAGRRPPVLRPRLTGSRRHWQPYRPTAAAAPLEARNEVILRTGGFDWLQFKVPKKLQVHQRQIWLKLRLLCFTLQLQLGLSVVLGIIYFKRPSEITFK